jgi:hypothetical protein
MTYFKEFILALSILIVILWIVNEYIAHLLSLVFIPILTGVLLISLLAEWIEPSRVPKSYFRYLVTAIIVIAFWYLLMKTLTGWHLH